MSEQDLKALFKKFLEDRISPEELQRLQGFVQDAGNADALDQLLQETYTNKRFSVNTDDDLETIFLEWKEKAGIGHIAGHAATASPVALRPHFLRRHWRVAASIALLLLAGGYFWLGSRPASTELADTAVPELVIPHDIAPGGNKAALTLGDGSVITLDDAKIGELAQQGSARIVKLANGQLSYTVLNAGSDEVFYNTMTTPRGGQYQLTLPDGTGVWLNASSSITYPSVFTDDQRKVTISGEAYFEVAPDKDKPFLVSVNETVVEVLGTHFNVNAYPEEGSIKTTLLEGAVKVISGDRLQRLSPGQQAQAYPKGELKLIRNADIEQAVAWKNGLFYFNNTDLQTVMNQLARWYNVEVAYAGEIPKGEFSGKIGRSLTLSQVLKVLAQTRVKFSIEEGNRIVILP